MGNVDGLNKADPQNLYILANRLAVSSLCSYKLDCRNYHNPHNLHCKDILGIIQSYLLFSIFQQTQKSKLTLTALGIIPGTVTSAYLIIVTFGETQDICFSTVSFTLYPKVKITEYEFKARKLQGENSPFSKSKKSYTQVSSAFSTAGTYSNSAMTPTSNVANNFILV